MKKLTFVLTLTLVTLVSNAQLTKLTPRAKEIKVGQIAPMGVFIAELTYNTNSTLGDTNYTLNFRNAKYTTLEDFKSI